MLDKAFTEGACKGVDEALRGVPLASVHVATSQDRAREFEHETWNRLGDAARCLKDQRYEDGVLRHIWPVFLDLRLGHGGRGGTGDRAADDVVCDADVDEGGPGGIESARWELKIHPQTSVVGKRVHFHARSPATKGAEPV